MTMQQTTSKVRVLPLVIACIGAFIVMRIVGLSVGISEATADEAVFFGKRATTQTTSAPLSVSVREEAPAPAAVKTKTERELLVLLKRRKEELDTREAELETREKLLIVAERSIDQKLDLIREERAFLSDEQRKRTEQRRAEFKELSNAYSRMKAKDAARIFETMDDEILVPVAAGMRVQAISGVLAEMSPEKARMLTKSLAEFSRSEE